MGVTEHVEGDECKFAIWTGRTPMSENRTILKVGGQQQQQQQQQLYLFYFFSFPKIAGLLYRGEAVVGEEAAGDDPGDVLQHGPAQPVHVDGRRRRQRQWRRWDGARLPQRRRGGQQHRQRTLKGGKIQIQSVSSSESTRSLPSLFTLQFLPPLGCGRGGRRSLEGPRFRLSLFPPLPLSSFSCFLV